MKDTLFVSFSGGRTSAYMAIKLMEQDKYDLKMLFANTGLEHEKTYDFIHDFEKHFNADIIWLEAVVNPKKGKGIRAKRVDYKSASRKGEPFFNYVSKYGIPNMTRPQCTSRLKTDVMGAYRRELGFKRDHPTAVGIRADERRRIKPGHYDKMNLVFPLADEWPTSKGEVLEFWKKMPFDLDLPEYKGNCVTCWKKSDRKLMTIALESPEAFEPFAKMEEMYGHLYQRERDRPLTFFRNHRSAKDIINEAKNSQFDLADDSNPIQLDMLTALDDEGDCGGSSCDIVASLEEEYEGESLEQLTKSWRKQA